MLLPLNKVRILDFDDTAVSQQRLIQAIKDSGLSLEVLDLKTQAQDLRFWAKEKDLNRLRASLPPKAGSAITFYGSGDFHHVTTALLQTIPIHISLIVFDHHPDWDGKSPYLSCGSWVSRIEESPTIEKILLLGPSSDDLSAGLATASFKALNQGKLEIYPYRRHDSSLFLRTLPTNECLTNRGNFIFSRIQWNNLADKDMRVFLEKLLKRIPTQHVYVSIDKDCLSRKSAITNWEQGQISLDWLVAALEYIKKVRTLVGVDITGDYSVSKTAGLVKTFISRFDHRFADPVSDEKGAKEINESTNLRLFQALTRVA
jgi:hypothetical protein